jgi:hypothetical protein
MFAGGQDGIARRPRGRHRACLNAHEPVVWHTLPARLSSDSGCRAAPLRFYYGASGFLNRSNMAAEISALVGHCPRRCPA